MIVDIALPTTIRDNDEGVKYTHQKLSDIGVKDLIWIKETHESPNTRNYTHYWRCTATEQQITMAILLGATIDYTAQKHIDKKLNSIRLRIACYEEEIAFLKVQMDEILARSGDLTVDDFELK